MSETKKRGRGRPRKDQFTAEQTRLLEKWAQVGATQEEMATLLGIDADTLRKRVEDNISVRAAVKGGQAKLKISLRRRQVAMALGREAEYGKDPETKERVLLMPAIEPSTTMLIWCGKTILGQSDRLNVKIESPGDALNILRDIFPEVDEDTLREIQGIDPEKVM